MAPTELILPRGAYGDELEHKSYWGAAEGPGLAQSGEKELKGDLISLCNCLCSEVGSSLFAQVTSNRTRNGCMGKFRLCTRKNFFTVRVVRHWNKLSREAVETPSLALFKKHVAPGDMVEWQQSRPRLVSGTHWILEVFSKPNNSLILQFYTSLWENTTMQKITNQLWGKIFQSWRVRKALVTRNYQQ